MKDDLTNTMLKLYTFSEVVTKQGMQQQGDEVATKQVMKERKRESKGVNKREVHFMVALPFGFNKLVLSSQRKGWAVRVKEIRRSGYVQTIHLPVVAGGMHGLSWRRLK